MFRMYSGFACGVSLVVAISCGWIAAPQAVAQGQVSLEPLFDTVINVPTGADIGNFVDIGDEDGSTTTQLNISDGGSVGIGVEVFNSEVNISGGSVGSSFDVFNSEVNISGGSIGIGFEAFDSEVNISGGSVDIGFDAFDGSVVNISGGTVGSIFHANPGSVVNISGGTVDIGFEAFEGSVVNVSGGSVGAVTDALFGSVINISGGSIGDFFDAFSGSEINLFGSDFFINELSLGNSLAIDDAFTVFERGDDVILTGLLADGSPFSFDLNSVEVLGQDFFDPSATLTVTLVSAVPEPSSLTLFGLSGLMLLGRRRKTCAGTERSSAFSAVN